jgi:hypothetical protein
LSERANARRAAPARSGFRGLELWCVELQAAGRALLELERRTPRLSGSERENARTFADAVVAYEWLAAHVALRVLLERAAGAEWRGVPFVRAGHGKPRLDGAPVARSAGPLRARQADQARRRCAGFQFGWKPHFVRERRILRRQ